MSNDARGLSSDAQQAAAVRRCRATRVPAAEPQSVRRISDTGNRYDPQIAATLTNPLPGS